MEGEVEEAAGVQTYWSRVSIEYGDQPGKLAIHELRVSVRGAEIIGIQFTHPVFEITGMDGPYTYVHYTGVNQTLCVKSAR
jgi:hypothetical protein